MNAAAGLEPLLRVHGLHVRFGGVHAVDGVDLDLRPGEIHGLIGPNGAGKTTLVDALSGYVTPSAGEVMLDGGRVTRWSPHRLARVGLVRTFQNLEMFNDMTIQETLAVARRSRRPDSDQETCDLLGLTSALHQRASDLSHGERRLASVARALVTGPRALVLDEPAAGLNSTETGHLGKVLDRLAQDGLAILLIDHDMDLVFETCHWVTVLSFGAVIARGTPDKVRRDAVVQKAYLGEL